MSIFGKADADLPLVTQLMQVDLTKEREVLRFWHRTVALAKADSVNHFAARMETDAESSSEESAPDGIASLETDWIFNSEAFNKRAEYNGYENAGQYLLKQFTTACEYGQEIFLTLYEHHSFPYLRLMWFRSTFAGQNQLQPHPSLTISLLEDEKDEEALEPYFGIDGMVPAFNLATILPGYYLAAQVEQTLMDLWSKKVRMAKCPECENVFVARREWAEYCSARCSSRVRQRRHRETSKITTK